MPVDGIDQEVLRRALRGEPDAATRNDRLDLASWIARQDRPALLSLAEAQAAHPTLTQTDRVRLIYAIAGTAPSLAARILDGVYRTLSARQSESLAAALYLAPSARVHRPGTVAMLAGQQLPIVKALINRKADGMFLVDTGAPHTVLSTAWCERKGVALETRHPHRVDDGSGNVIEAAAVRLDSLEAGAMAQDVPAIRFAFPAGLDVAGILSPLDTFVEAPVLIDFAARSLTVAGPPIQGASVPLLWRGGVPCLQARVAGNDAILMLDTGAGGEALCDHFATEAGIAASHWTTTQSAAGSVSVGLGPEVNIQVGTLTRRTRIAIKPCAEDDPAAPLLDLDGLLGLGWLDGRRIMISADRRKLTIAGI